MECPLNVLLFKKPEFITEHVDLNHRTKAHHQEKFL
jgi:hypothetical protein